MNTRCSMNVYKFPFDIQTCSIVIGSWSLPNLKIIMNYNPILNASGFVENSVWSVINQNVFVKNTSRLNAQYLSSDIYFQGTFKRKPMYYLINNVYPCLILNIITLFTFKFPFPIQATLSKYFFIYTN